MGIEKWLNGLQLAYVASVCITLALTVVIYPLSKRASSDKDRQIAENEAAAEEARATAAKAQLELARFKAPRVITPEQSTAIVRAMRKFEGQRYALSSHGDTEALDYVYQIDRVMENAGWVRVEPQLGDIQLTTAGGLIVGKTSGSRRGVTVLIGMDNADAAPALAALAKVLRSVGISCGKASAPALKGKTPKAITIDVGQKRTD